MPNFTITKQFLLPSFELSNKEREKIDAFLEILDQANIEKYIGLDYENGDKSQGGRPSYNPYRLFATIAYAFSKHSGSLRKIEESINYDLRFIYLMEQDRPSYVTISKFLNNIIVKFHQEIFTSIVKTIISKFDINIDDVFLDGTKLEANANKYKFVWKPTTFHLRLNETIKGLINKYFADEFSKNKILKSKDVGLYLDCLLRQIDAQGIDLKSLKFGRGYHCLPIVKDYLLLQKYLLKTLEYEEKEAICGQNRHSYFTTDHDATAMCLKEDYYSGLGSNMHAAYNAQIIVSKGIILAYYVGQERTDYYAFIPMLDAFKYGFAAYPKRLCADAGYGSYSNYQYLKAHRIENYVKYQSWQQEMTGTQVDLFSFNEFGQLVCLRGKVAVTFDLYYGRRPKKGTMLYVVTGCKGCRLKCICKAPIKNKDESERVFEVNRELQFFKQEARSNLLSVKGIEMRVNRSSQVEGAFGVIKHDMDYDRIRRRGLENVRAEFMLVSLGYVIRKLFTLIDGTAKLDYWQAPLDLQAAVMPEANIKKLLKKTKLGKNETLRKSYKRHRKRAARNAVVS